MGEMNFTFEDIFGSKGKMLDEMTQENQPSINKKSSENNKRLQEDSRYIIQLINFSLNILLICCIRYFT